MTPTSDQAPAQTTAEQINLENPLGVDGFEFVEFTGPEPKAMISRLEMMGFTQTHVNPKTDVVRLKQGDISFLVHRTPNGQAQAFAADHGPSANGMAFRTNDAKAAYEGALQRGAVAATDANGGALGDYPYILQGIGGSLLYVIDQYGDAGSLYDTWDEIVRISSLSTSAPGESGSRADSSLARSSSSALLAAICSSRSDVCSSIRV